jgi:hypothetical protein
MLNFSTKPDKIFTKILTDSLEKAVGKLKQFGKKELKDILPHASKVFDVKTAIKTMERLIVCTKSSGVYDINDYHYVLIYDALQDYCDIEEKFEYVPGTKIGKVDFSSLIFFYFHDIDFLLSKEKVLNPAAIETICTETVALVLGKKPGPDELEIKLLKKEQYCLDDEGPLYGPETTVYPDSSIGEEEFDSTPLPPETEEFLKEFFKPGHWEKHVIPTMKGKIIRLLH